MRIRTLLKCFTGLLAAALAGSPALAAEPPEITIAPLACVPSAEKNTNAKVVVTVNRSFTPASVRLYFIAEGALMYHEAHGKIREQEKDAFYRDPKGQNYFHPDHHTGYRYHEMVKGGDGSYWAMLPKVAPGTTDVYFHAVVVDAGGRQYPSADVRVPVTNACPAPELGREEKKYADHLVVGLTAERQTAVPPGFVCDGIVSFVTPSGDLRENEECRRCACGIAPVWWVAGGAALAGGGVIIEDQRGHAHHHPVSPARP